MGALSLNGVDRRVVAQGHLATRTCFPWHIDASFSDRGQHVLKIGDAIERQAMTPDVLHLT